MVTQPARAPRPQGTVTRGTTHPNRLRRVDRWLVRAAEPVLRDAPRPVVVDLGYGAEPVTTAELAHRLRAVRPDVEVVGIEIDPDRVQAAGRWEGPRLTFRLGGFELPLPDGARPVVVRAFNVLRQYPEDAVPGAWRTMVDRLAPGGLLVEGTCDEVGRRASWVTVRAGSARERDATPVPETLTLAAHLGSLARPGDLAERLPKALIHRNVPGEGVHDLLRRLDRAWAAAAPYAAFGARQRWVATVRSLASDGVPVRDGPARWRLGEVTVPWSAVAPTTG